MADRILVTSCMHEKLPLPCAECNKLAAMSLGRRGFCVAPRSPPAAFVAITKRLIEANCHLLPFELNLDGEESKRSAVLKRTVPYHGAVADAVRRLPMQFLLVEIGRADAKRWQHGQF